MKRGRPNVASKKNRTARVNLDDDSYEELSYLSEKSGRSRADILREAFNYYKNLLKYQLENDEDDD